MRRAREAETKLPQIRLGPHSISRLICGANPFNAGSHLSVFVNHEMRSYYTPEQILKTLRRCQEVGINCWQSGGGNFELYRRFVDEGGKMHFLAIEAGEPGGASPKLAKGGCIGVAHHGEVTDQLFKQGKLDEIHDFLKRVRDAGLLVGVSTHMPAVVDADRIEGLGPRLLHDLRLRAAPQRGGPGEAARAGADPGGRGLPAAATRRGCSRPCGRRSGPAWRSRSSPPAGSPSARSGSSRRSARPSPAIKPSDGVIVGIYDRYSDQPAEDAELVRRYGESG